MERNKKRINYLGFLSLLSLIAVLGIRHPGSGLFGFFGFFYYVRYFWVVPDELFLLNVRKSASAAFMAEMVFLVPFMFICAAIYGVPAAVPMAFGLSFCVCILSFTVSLTVWEWRERRGASE